MVLIVQLVSGSMALLVSKIERHTKKHMTEVIIY